MAMLSINQRTSFPQREKKLKPLASYEHWCFHFGYFIANLRGIQMYFPREEFDYKNQELHELPLGTRV